MRRKFLFLLIALLTFVCASCDDSQISIFSRPVVERPEGGRKDWLDVSSFICYYGDFVYEVQSKFDVVIMHSSTLYGLEEAKAKEEVKKLKDAGCYVISYITIGEDDEMSVADGLGEGGYASYYIYEGGVPKMNTAWGSWFVDAGNPVWQAKVIAETEKVLDYGVDGIFMDTLDTVDIAPETIYGMADLVKKLDETFPDAKFVANRGFTVLPYISKYIDGLMFESFNSTIDFVKNKVIDLNEEARAWNDDIACNTLNSIRRYHYFPVFALDYANKYEYTYMPQAYYDNSWAFDFIPYSTYDRGLHTATYPVDADGNMIVPKSERGNLALSKLASNSSLGINGDTSANNLVYKDNGVKVTVDSCYGGYKEAAINDGWYVTPENHIQGNWAKESWASREAASDHWIQFEFDSEKEVNKVVIHWANDNDIFYQSKQIIIKALINGKWEEVAMKDNAPDEDGYYKAQEQTWVLTFDTVKTTAIQIYQPKECGPHTKFNDPLRPNIMWVSEIEMYKEAK